jgi:hypothetical protein
VQQRRRYRRARHPWPGSRTHPSKAGDDRRSAPSDHCTNGYLGGWQYNPRYPSGGYQTESTTYPSWTGTCVPVSAGTWSRSITQGSDFKLTGGVKAFNVIGINLSADSAYASDHALFYKLTSSGHVCGSDNVPSYANQIKTAA